MAGELGLTLTHRVVDTPKLAEDLSFRGSPTVLLDGVDLFAEGHEPVGLACRLYASPDGPAGSRTLDPLRRAITIASATDN